MNYYYIINRHKEKINLNKLKNDDCISIKATNGLNNRLEVLLSYLHLSNKLNKKFKLYWPIDETCPDHFNNLFEDIPNVEFINNFKLSNIDFITHNPYNYDYVKDNYYNLLKPKEHIKNKINLIINKLENNYIACHVRRTDFLKEKYAKDYIKLDEYYFNFIDKFEINKKIYLATDNYDTQQSFIKKYGNRIECKIIEKSNKLRQTSLEDAVIDIYVCANANDFIGTQKSTFSNTIINLRNL